MLVNANKGLYGVFQACSFATIVGYRGILVEHSVDLAHELLVVFAMLELLLEHLCKLDELAFEASNLGLGRVRLLLPVHARSKRTYLVPDLVSFLLILCANALGNAIELGLPLFDLPVRGLDVLGELLRVPSKLALASRSLLWQSV